MQALHRVNGVVSSPLPTTLSIQQNPEEKERRQEKVVGPPLNGTTPVHTKTGGGDNMMTLSRLASLTKTLNHGGGGGVMVNTLNGGLGGGEVSFKGANGGYKQHQLVIVNSTSTRTEATPSSTDSAGRIIRTSSSSSSSSSSNGTETQGFIKRHCCSVMEADPSHISNTQLILEERVRSSLKKLRCRQLHLSHTHTLNQVSAAHKRRVEDDEDTSGMLIDGNSNTSLTSSLDTSAGSSVLAPPPPRSPGKVANALQHHLHYLESFVDDDATDASSDEEETETLPPKGRAKSKNDRYMRYVRMFYHYECITCIHD